MHKGNDPSERRPQIIRIADVMRLLNFGWVFAGCLGVGIGGGIALDNWLNTRPGFLLGGLLLGTVAGFYAMYRMLRPFFKERGMQGDPRRANPEARNDSGEPE